MAMIDLETKVDEVMKAFHENHSPAEIAGILNWAKGHHITTPMVEVLLWDSLPTTNPSFETFPPTKFSTLFESSNRLEHEKYVHPSRYHAPTIDLRQHLQSVTLWWRQGYTPAEIADRYRAKGFGCSPAMVRVFLWQYLCTTWASDEEDSDGLKISAPTKLVVDKNSASVMEDEGYMGDKESEGEEDWLDQASRLIPFFSS